jgi:hypothetical protein
MEFIALDLIDLLNSMEIELVDDYTEINFDFIDKCPEVLFLFFQLKFNFNR